MSLENIDARGPRFSALLTTIVLSIALATNSELLLALQAVVFAIGAIKGPQATPYSAIFRKFIKPRLKSEAKFEDIRPPQFAQRVGLGFALVGLFGAVAAPVLFHVAVSFALAAAFLNAAFDFCLGCQIYLLFERLRAKPALRA